VKLGDAAQAETIRTMIVAMARDPRVLVIKLAERLHNMRTLRFLPREAQEAKARETLEILAPLAHRLGMNTIRWELEDLAFATLHPTRYDEVVRLVAERAPSRETYLAEVTSTVGDQLRAAKIEAVVTGRPRHYYSIYKKLVVQGLDVTDIWDLVGVRILVDSVRDCYAALGIMHAHWQPVPGRFEDFVAMPKFNMYQALKTTVIGPQGKPVELMIRTHEMHRSVEFRDTTANTDDMLWLRQLLDWQREAREPGRPPGSRRDGRDPQEIFVFSPKGDVFDLPGGSTPVDFAYAVHTEVGHRCIGARVNGNLVSLDTTLTHGDVIEIFTSRSPTAGPSPDWLSSVRSSRARRHIRRRLTRDREDSVEAGKRAVGRAVRRAGLSMQHLLGGEALPSVAEDLHLDGVTALFAAVGEQQLSAASVVERLLASLGTSDGPAEEVGETAFPGPRPSAAAGPRVVGDGTGDVWAAPATCCGPLPGEDVLGFVTRGGVVRAHRSDCPHMADLQRRPERLVEVTWEKPAGATSVVSIRVEALDRHRLLSDVTGALSEQRVRVLSASVQSSRDRVAISSFTFELADPAHLEVLLQAVRDVEGVFDVERA
jgi:GTP pyrophosphokinase